MGAKGVAGSANSRLYPVEGQKNIRSETGVSSGCLRNRHYQCFRLNCTCPCHRTLSVPGR